MIDYAKVEQLVTKILQSEDYRGGPLQRQYPPIIIQTMAEAIAGGVQDLAEGREPYELRNP